MLSILYYPTVAMASLIKKIKKGHTYYYAAESARVNGKPRIVWQKYLGTLDSIVKRSDQAKPAAPKEAVLFQAGGVGALLRITQRLDVLDLINQIVPKRDQGPSVGYYMILAALNRALAPCSKQAIGDWYEQTILRRLWRYPKSSFSISAVEKPLRAASRAIPAPVIPPPMTKTSYSVLFILSIVSSRYFKSVIMLLPNLFILYCKIQGHFEF